MLSSGAGVTPKKCDFLQVVDPFGDNLCGENHNLWVNHIAVTTRCSDDCIRNKGPTQVIRLYMAFWACRDHYMMWFLDFEMGFDQGFWVLGRLRTARAALIALYLLSGNPKPIIMGLCYSWVYENNR